MKICHFGLMSEFATITSPFVVYIHVYNICFISYFGFVGDFATITSPFLKDPAFLVQNSTSTTSPSYPYTIL